MKHVYVAGPYSIGDVAQNVRRAMEAAHVLIVAGHAPYIPHLAHFLHLHQPQDYETWMRLDLAWLSRCDALVRLPGESEGADREVAEAHRCNIPVVRIVAGTVGWTDQIDQLPVRR